MAHIVVNAMNLRPGGGLQVVAGLLSRFCDRHRYTVLWADEEARERFARIVPDRSHVTWERPLASASNTRLFVWSMTSLAGWLRAARADLVFSVNHHYPSGGVPQAIYHLNVLRFERPRAALFAPGEIADRLRDWRAAVALRAAAANMFESRLLLETAQRARGRIANPSVAYIGIDDQRSAAAGPGAIAKPTLLAVTSAEPHKDNPTLVRTLAELVRRRPDVDWRLKIAGGRSPAAFDDLMRLAVEAGVRDRIELLGFRSHEELARVAAECLCLVSTSLVESFCMVALEAMAWGLPTIVADISAMPESVGNAGLLASPSDPASFAERVLSLLDDPALRSELVERGRERAGRMTWSSAARQIEDTFDSVLAGASGAARSA